MKINLKGVFFLCEKAFLYLAKLCLPHTSLLDSVALVKIYAAIYL